MDMAKRKLLEWMRDRLNQHVNDNVDPPAERKALDTAYRKIAPMITRLVAQKYKPTDMAILEKYGAASLDDCIRLTLPDSRVVEFEYRHGEGATTPNARGCQSRMYLANEIIAAAFDAHATAKEAHEKETQKRITAYRTLIRSASTVEDLVEVWPEAAALLPATAVMAPLTEEQLALIRADTTERKAA